MAASSPGQGPEHAALTFVWDDLCKTYPIEMAASRLITHCVISPAEKEDIFQSYPTRSGKVGALLDIIIKDIHIGDLRRFENFRFVLQFSSNFLRQRLDKHLVEQRRRVKTSLCKLCSVCMVYLIAVMCNTRGISILGAWSFGGHND